MSDTTFSSEEECRAFVAQQLLAERCPPDIVQTLAARLAQTCEHHSAPRLGMGFRVRRWVIRQEDLGFFNVLRTGALAGVAAMSGATLAAPIVGALAAAVETSWNLWRKGARIEPLDLPVLVLLEQTSDGLAPGDIAERLSDETKRWSPNEVEDILKRLSKLPTRAGTTAVVHESADGRWRHTH